MLIRPTNRRERGVARSIIGLRIAMGPIWFALAVLCVIASAPSAKAAAGDVLLSAADGAVRIDTGGNIFINGAADANHCPDCCPQSCCNNEVPPPTIQVAFASITHCCNTSFNLQPAAGSLNKNICCTRTTGCQWTYSKPCKIPLNGCNGNTQCAPGTLVVTVTKNSTTLTVLGTVGAGGPQFFNGTYSHGSAFGCSSGSYVVNNGLATNCTGKYGHSGTATVTFTSCSNTVVSPSTANATSYAITFAVGSFPSGCCQTGDVTDSVEFRSFEITGNLGSYSGLQPGVQFTVPDVSITVYENPDCTGTAGTGGTLELLLTGSCRSFTLEVFFQNAGNILAPGPVFDGVKCLADETDDSFQIDNDLTADSCPPPNSPNPNRLGVGGFATVTPQNGSN